jgi:hypothetical protein
MNKQSQSVFEQARGMYVDKLGYKADQFQNIQHRWLHEATAQESTAKIFELELARYKLANENFRIAEENRNLKATLHLKLAQMEHAHKRALVELQHMQAMVSP